MTHRVGHLDRRRLLAAGAAAGGLALAGRAGAAGPQQVIKTMSLLARKPDQSHQEFMTYWLAIHALLGRALPNLRGLICTEITGATNQRTDIATAGDVQIDGIAQIWSVPNAKPTIDERRWYGDRAHFAGQIRDFQVQETEFVRPPRGGKGLVSVITRKPKDSHENFVKHWLGVHGPMASQVPEVAGLVLDEVIASADPPDVARLPGLEDVDGIAESWHKDTSYAAVTSPEAKRWYADGADLIGLARGYYTQEHVIIDPAG